MPLITKQFPETMMQQEIFEEIVTFLLNQNRKSIKLDSYDRKCLYRGDENTACAVGCLIRDDEYKKEMDDSQFTSIYFLITLKLLPKRLIPHIDLLTEIQSIHDSTEPFEWRDKFIEIADIYNLNTDFMN